MFKPGDHQSDIENILVLSGNATKQELDPNETLGKIGDDLVTEANFMDSASSIIFYQKAMTGTWSPNSWKVFAFYTDRGRLIDFLVYDELLFSKNSNEGAKN